MTKTFLTRPFGFFVNHSLQQTNRDLRKTFWPFFIPNYPLYRVVSVQNIDKTRQSPEWYRHFPSGYFQIGLYKVVNTNLVRKTFFRMPFAESKSDFARDRKSLIFVF